MSLDNVLNELSDGHIWTQLSMVLSSAVSVLSNFSSNTLVAELGLASECVPRTIFCPHIPLETSRL